MALYLLSYAACTAILYLAFMLYDALVRRIDASDHTLTYPWQMIIVVTTIVAIIAIWHVHTDGNPAWYVVVEVGAALTALVTRRQWVLRRREENETAKPKQ